MSRKKATESFVSRKQIAGMIVGTLLYAALAIPTTVISLPSFGPVGFRPAVAIPMVLGFIFGPITGFVSGLLGSMISNSLSLGSVFWNWDVGIGLLGVVPGIAYFLRKKTDWTEIRNLTTAAILAIVASIVGIGFAAVTDYAYQINSGGSLFEFYLFSTMYAINGAILTPIILYVYARATSRSTHPM